MHRLAGAAMVALLGGCVTTTTLAPAPGARTLLHRPSAAVGDRNDVRIIVDDAWPGDPAIRDAVTPLRVTIENQSRNLLLVRYQDFALVSPTGKRWPAIPPFRIEGALRRPALASGYAPIWSPGFDHRGFFVAPYYRPLYPWLTPFGGPFFMTPSFYAHYGYWSDVVVPLPTPEMLRLALPEGVVEPGGRLQGYLYFRRIDPDVGLVYFGAELTSAIGGHRLGAIQIPLAAGRR
jgi:hypothetical protein